AFGAQGRAVGGVLHIAAGDDLPIGGQAGRADPERGVGSVGTFGRGRGGGTEPWPVDDHVTTLRHAGKGLGSGRIRLQGLPYPTGPFSRPARPPQGGGSR